MKRAFLKRYGDLWPILLLGGLVTTFFGRVLFFEKIFVYRDFLRYFYPTRYFAWESIRDGIIPLWNPYLFCGIPFLADLQSCVLYPPSIILYLLPFHLGLKSFCVFHFFLGGLFTYLLLRDLRLQRSASLAGAITFTFSGYLLSVVDMITSLTSAIWTPLVFLFFNRAIDSESKDRSPITDYRYTILTGVALGIQFLGGEPTVLYGTVISLFLFALVKGIVGVLDEGFRVKRLRSIFYSLLSACIIAMGLTLFQALPFLEMVVHSTRWDGVSYKEASFWSFSPQELIELFIPEFFGGVEDPSYFPFVQQWLKTPYIGILPLCLLFLAPIYTRRIFFSLILLLFLFLSFGSYFGLYPLLYRYLPFFYLIRYPVKYLCMVSFFSSVLVGFGFNSIITSKSKGLWLFLPLSLIYLLLWSLGPFHPILFDILVGYCSISGMMDPLKILTMAFDTIIPVILAFLLMATLLAYLFKKGRISVGCFKTCILTLIIVDLFYFGSMVIPLVREDEYTNKPEVLGQLQKGDPYFRISLTPKTKAYYYMMRGFDQSKVLKDAMESLIPNLGLPHHLYDAYGYASLKLRDYETLFSTIENTQAHPLLNLLNIRYIVSKWEIKREDLLPFYHTKWINIYENPHCLPRAFIVGKAVVIKDRDKIIERLLSQDFHPKNEVILEEKPRVQGPGLVERSFARIIDYQPNRVTIQVRSSKPGLLFLSDTYYPGWEAYIDRVKRKIYRANYAFRAIEVPPGDHIVEFVYRPPSFRIGVLGSIVTMMALIGYCVWRGIKG